MKKILAILALALIFVVTLTGCSNKQTFDFAQKFDRVILQLPDGTIIDGVCQSWRDFEDGDQLQVKVNGKTYLVHSSDCVLIIE